MNQPDAKATIHVHTREQICADVETLLGDYYRARIQAAEQLHPDYARLWQVMFQVHQAGGKRMRPYLMMLAYEGFGGASYASALRVAAALELLHTSMLMHDDIIDRDYIRHGQLNVAGQYKELYEEHRDAVHYAHSAALLAGDLALSSAYQLILQSNLPNADQLRMQQRLSDIIFTVAGGELLDSESVMSPIESVESKLIMEMKTASYSFTGPLTMGADLAGADPVSLASLRSCGQSLGVAFQLGDDLLGLFGDESKTGKSATSDIEEGKPTYLMQQALARAKAPDRLWLLSMLGSDTVDSAAAGRVREIVESTGARTDTEALIARYAEAARGALTGLAIDAGAKLELGHIIDSVHKRRS